MDDGEPVPEPVLDAFKALGRNDNPQATRVSRTINFTGPFLCPLDQVLGHIMTILQWETIDTWRSVYLDNLSLRDVRPLLQVLRAKQQGKDPWIRFLSLESNLLNEESLAALCDSGIDFSTKRNYPCHVTLRTMAKHLHCLISLNDSYSNVPIDDWRVLCSALRTNTSLRHLELRECYLGNDLSDVLFPELFAALAHHPTLQVLILACMSRGPQQHFQGLANYLRTPGCRLAELDISHNPISKNGFREIEAICREPNLALHRLTMRGLAPVNWLMTLRDMRQLARGVLYCGPRILSQCHMSFQTFRTEPTDDDQYACECAKRLPLLVHPLLFNTNLISFSDGRQTCIYNCPVNVRLKQLLAANTRRLHTWRFLCVTVSFLRAVRGQHYFQDSIQAMYVHIILPFVGAPLCIPVHGEREELPPLVLSQALLHTRYVRNQVSLTEPAPTMPRRNISVRRKRKPIP